MLLFFHTIPYTYPPACCLPSKAPQLSRPEIEQWQRSIMERLSSCGTGAQRQPPPLIPSALPLPANGKNRFVSHVFTKLVPPLRGGAAVCAAKLENWYRYCLVYKSGCVPLAPTHIHGEECLHGTDRYLWQAYQLLAAFRHGPLQHALLLLHAGRRGGEASARGHARLRGTVPGGERLRCPGDRKDQGDRRGASGQEGAGSLS